MNAIYKEVLAALSPSSVILRFDVKQKLSPTFLVQKNMLHNILGAHHILGGRHIENESYVTKSMPYYMALLHTVCDRNVVIMSVKLIQIERVAKTICQLRVSTTITSFLIN